MRQPIKYREKRASRRDTRRRSLHKKTIWESIAELLIFATLPIILVFLVSYPVLILSSLLGLLFSGYLIKRYKI